MNHRILLAGAVLTILACWSSEGRAQTCDTAIPVNEVNLVYSGNSCGANHLPALNVGTWQTPGNDVVYQVHVEPDGYPITSFVFTSEENQTLYLCRGPCGPASTCVDARATGTSGFAEIPAPIEGGDFYLIVDSPTFGGCGDYTLTASGPLGQ